MRRMVLRLSLAGLAVLAGCATPTPPSITGAPMTPSGSPAAEPPRPGQPPPTVLAAEVRWMQALFDGTPVRVASESDGAMRVDVPMTFSFDDKSASPKPPLRAVLDKLAASMSRQPSTKLQVTAPGPATRAAAMRTYLGSRGVIALRVVMQPASAGETVTMRVVPGPVAIDKLEDHALPSPAGAFPASRAASRATP